MYTHSPKQADLITVCTPNENFRAYTIAMPVLDTIAA